MIWAGDKAVSRVNKSTGIERLDSAYGFCPSGNVWQCAGGLHRSTRFSGESGQGFLTGAKEFMSVDRWVCPREPEQPG